MTYGAHALSLSCTPGLTTSTAVNENNRSVLQSREQQQSPLEIASRTRGEVKGSYVGGPFLIQGSHLIRLCVIRMFHTAHGCTPEQTAKFNDKGKPSLLLNFKSYIIRCIVHIHTSKLEAIAITCKLSVSKRYTEWRRVVGGHKSLSRLCVWSVTAQRCRVAIKRRKRSTGRRISRPREER